MLFAEIPTWAIDLGAACGIVTIVCTTLVKGIRSRPGQWVTKNLREDASERRRSDIADILQEQLPTHLRPIIAQLYPNSGSSFFDKVTMFMDDMNKFRAETSVEQENTRKELDRIHELIRTHHP